ncbi:MAG: S8 family serine peptidase [Longimicrobiales bacterium]
MRIWLAAVGLATALAGAMLTGTVESDRRRTVWLFLDQDSARSAALPAIGSGAMASRRRLGLAPLDNDRPIPPHLMDRIEAAGATIRVASRWLRAVSVNADASTLARLRALPFVSAVQPVATLQRASAARAAVHPPVIARRTGARGASAQQAPDSTFYGPNWKAIRDLGVPSAQAFGFRGENIRIAILDTGFETRHEAFDGRRVLAARDFINGDAVVYNEPGDSSSADQARHGTQVWSLIGAFRPGQMVGPAYDAQFILAKVDLEPGDTQADEDRWVAAIEWADSLDARIISTSSVFRTFTDQQAIPYAALNGDSTITTRMADEAARRGVLFITAMGNNGPAPRSLASPADGDSVFAVGAVDVAGQIAPFSGRGPTSDGRIKPDVAARGVQLTAATSLSLVGYEISLQGTSYSTALVTAGAAMVMQAWPNLSSAAILRAIRLSATHPFSPDNARGAGVPNIAGAILFPDGLAPTNVATIDLQGAVTTIAPTFNWRASAVQTIMRPVLYRLEVASDSLFGNILYTDTARDAFSLTATRALKPTANAYWRIIATAALGITTTSPAGPPFRVPRWVRLVAPAGDQPTFVDDERPVLSWAPLAAPPPIGPLTYDVEVLSNETGLPVQPTLRNVTGSSVRVAQPLVPNTAYRWRVIAHARLGGVDTIASVAAFVVTSEANPPVTLLYQNFPNPFPRADLGAFDTNVWFDLADTSSVSLVVLDLRGRLVRSLIPADPSCGTITLEPGIYGRGGTTDPGDPCVQTSWDGRDGNGRALPRGLYLLRLIAGGKTQYRRMLHLPQ